MSDNPTFTHSDVYALILPENTVAYGGAATRKVYESIRNLSFDTVVVIAPSHSGSAERITITQASEVNTPSGLITINDVIREELCDEDDDIFLDDLGHHDALGILTQIPYLQHALGEFDLVPIVMKSTEYDLCQELGYALSEVMYNRSVLLVATVDFRSGSLEQLNEVISGLKEVDVEKVVHSINHHHLDVHGKGALLATLMASQYHGKAKTKVMHLQPAKGSDPGVIGAVIYRP